MCCTYQTSCLQEDHLKQRRNLEVFYQLKDTTTQNFFYLKWFRGLQSSWPLPQNLGKKDSRVKGKGLDAHTWVQDPCLSDWNPWVLRVIKPHFPHWYKWKEQHLSHNFCNNSTLSPRFHLPGVNASPLCFLKTKFTLLSQSILGALTFVCWLSVSVRTLRT